MTFSDLPLIRPLVDAVAQKGYAHPTPIQEQAIPPALEGRDLLGCAQTGTGKTAAFTLPILQQLAEAPRPKGRRPIRALVLTPTRELAIQIEECCRDYAGGTDIRHCVIFGGVSQRPQVDALRRGVDLLVATPGRLLDLVGQGHVSLASVAHFVLDEADRMLDMGFYDDIMQIVKRLPANRQTLMFSATMPPKTRQLAKAILTDPAEVRIAVSRPTEKIDQSAFVCHEAQKTPLLKHLFSTAHSQRVIVFAASKLKVKDLTRELRRARFKAAEMHSDLEQQQRNEVMQAFRAGKIDILVATDILARGIDIDDIAMVVNYDVPREAEDYVHRIGRTARANADGMAVTLVSGREQQKFGSIERFLGYEVKKNEIPAEFGEAPAYNPDRKPHGQRPHGGKRPKGGKPGRNNAHHGNNRDNRHRQKPRATS